MIALEHEYRDRLTLEVCPFFSFHVTRGLSAKIYEMSTVSYMKNLFLVISIHCIKFLHLGRYFSLEDKCVLFLYEIKN